MILGLALAASTLPAAAKNPCPGPKCPKYRIACSSIANCRWPASRDGVTRIPYWINPDQPWMSEAHAIGGIRAGARAWEMYNPRLRFVYMGVTDDPPIPGDQKLVIGWVPLGVSAALVYGKAGDHDVFLSIEQAMRWVPCVTRCTAIRTRYCSPWCVPGAEQFTENNQGGGNTSYIELQQLMTHELGHVVGLGEADVAWRGLTMSVFVYEEAPPLYETRELSTLGLGDVLGMKKLYPWKCPKLKRGQRYPSAYRHLCPSIQIFAP